MNSDVIRENDQYFRRPCLSVPGALIPHRRPQAATRARGPERGPSQGGERKVQDRTRPGSKKQAQGLVHSLYAACVFSTLVRGPWNPRSSGPCVPYMSKTRQRYIVRRRHQHTHALPAGVRHPREVLSTEVLEYGLPRCRDQRQRHGAGAHQPHLASKGQRSMYCTYIQLLLVCMENTLRCA